MAATLIEAPVMPALTSTRTVVIVEDDDSMRGALGRLLHAAGFACKAYASAEAVMADPDNAGSACVVSDLMLPGMSGLELMAALCARGTRWPLILITAHQRRTDPLRHQARLGRNLIFGAAAARPGGCEIRVLPPWDLVISHQLTS